MSSAPSPLPVQWVVFDLGGVMIRLADGWQAACARVGVEPGPGFDPARFAEQVGEVVDACERNAIDQQEFCLRVGRLAEMDAADVHAVATAWLVGPYPGLDALLDELALAGLRTACLSNTNAHHWSLMTSTGHAASLPLHRLDRRFASHLVEARKPEAEIYAHVEDELEVGPERIAFFDDNPPNIQAALSRGWQAVQIDPTGDPAAQVRQSLAGWGVLRATKPDADRAAG
ncbi:MAG: HAD-IA family hydrolase [Planctomycetota bacterium]